MTSLRPTVNPICGSVVIPLVLGILGVVTGLLHWNGLAMGFAGTLLLFSLSAFLILRAALGKIEVERLVLPGAFERDQLDVTIRLHNRSRYPVFFPVVADLFTPEFYANKTMVFPYRVMPGETVEELYRGQCLLPRGIFKIGPAVLAVSDPFGWIQLRREISCQHRIKIYPKILTCGLRDRPGRSSQTLQNERAHHHRGESLEFFSVREYQPGDPQRRIHWPLTARRGFPVVKEFTRDSAGNLTIFLDLYRKALVGIGRGSNLEYAIKAGVAIANRALRQGHRVQLLALGRELLLAPPGRGFAQLHRILELVVNLRADGDQPLPELLARERHRVRGGDTVVYTVSPYLYQSGALLDQVRILKGSGIRQIAIVFDHQTFRALRSDDFIQGYQMAACLKRLQSLNVETFSVACGADLTRVFQEGKP